MGFALSQYDDAKKLWSLYLLYTASVCVCETEYREFKGGMDKRL